jgi:thiamine biosynthesis lipoprotein
MLPEPQTLHKDSMMHSNKYATKLRRKEVTDQLSFDAIGTKWRITIGGLDNKKLKEFTQDINDLIEVFDKKYSRFRKDSLITEMSEKGGRYIIDAEFYELVNFYERLYNSTEGKVTPLIGQALSDAGYDADYSFRPGTLVPPPSWEETIRYDKHSLTLDSPVLLDFGTAGKGYLVDLIAALMERSGVSNYVINAGGDIRHRDSAGESVDVGLENPKDFSQAIGIISLSNQSLCASATSRRVWEGFSHIIDPKTLKSPSEIIATWVVADTTMHADGIATALFFVEPAKLKSFSFNYVILYKDMSLAHSKAMDIKIFEEA